MNTLLHFLLNYIIIDAAFGNAIEYILPIFIASTILDLDHIPFLFSKKRGSLLKEGFGEKSRSFIHEGLGLLIVSMVGVSLLIITKGSLLVKIIFSCLLLHYVFDFLWGKSRPFMPFSKKVFHSPIITEKIKKKVLIEIIITLIAGAVFLMLL